MNKATQYILFFALPVAAVVIALRDIRSITTRNIIWLYCGFFGFTFVISSSGIDAAVYKSWFEIAHNSTTITLGSIFNDPTLTDYFVHVTNYFVSRFTGDYRVLFLIFGLIYGYFFASNIQLISKQMSKKWGLAALVFFILFAFVVPFWNINGIRFYLATHIFFYGISRFIILKKWNYLLWLGAAMFVHFAFVFISIIYLAYLIFGKYRFFIVTLSLLALLLGGLGFSDIIPFIPKLDGVIGAKVNGYTYEEFVLNTIEVKQEASWFLFLREGILNYTICSFSLYFIFFHDALLRKFKVHHFIYFGLLLISLSISLDVIPSMSRMMYIGHLFIAAGFSVLLSQTPRLYWSKRFVPFCAAAIALFVIVEVRIGLDFIGIGSFINNPFLMAFIDYKDSLGQYF